MAIEPTPVEKTTDPVTAVMSTEEDIMDSIGEGVHEPTTTEEAPSTTETPTEVSSESTDPASGEVVDGTVTTKPEEKPVVNGPQDLKDVHGNVIATAGKERRFYETAQRLKRDLDKSTVNEASLTKQVEVLTAAGNVGTQYGLTPDELTAGAQLMKQFKEDPAGTAKYLLTQAQALGHNVEGAGTNDMAAIKQMMQDMIAPLTASTQATQENDAAQVEAQRQYDEFTGLHPDAVVHVDTLSQLLNKEPNLSVEAAYWKLKSFYSENSLDWTKTLDVIKSEAANAPTTDPVVPDTQQVPSNAANIDNLIDTTTVADTDMSMGDIVKQSMRDAGMKIE